MRFQTKAPGISLVAFGLFDFSENSQIDQILLKITELPDEAKSLEDTILEHFYDPKAIETDPCTECLQGLSTMRTTRLRAIGKALVS